VAPTGHKTGHTLAAVLLALLIAPASADELHGPPAPDRRAIVEEPAPRAFRGAARDVAWMAGAAGFDLVTKAHALDHCPSCFEANPIMRDADGGLDLSQALLWKAGATAGVGALCYTLRRRGHEREAKIARWVVVAVWVGAGVVNVARAH
jgi:hypothetical protein